MRLGKKLKSLKPETGKRSGASEKNLRYGKDMKQLKMKPKLEKEAVRLRKRNGASEKNMKQV